MSSTRRRVVTTVGVGAAAAIGAAVAHPAVRAEARRLRGFVRQLDTDKGAPVPPPLPQGHTVLLEGVGEVFARDSGGDGQVVLLLHGWGATADSNFFRVYPALSDAYRVVALDHRDHGRGLRVSTPFRLEDCADDAAGLLAALGIERAIVVGYSMGGPIALLLAQRHPGRCAGLVLEATALEFHEGLRERLLWRSLSVLEAGLRLGSGDGVVQRVLRAAAAEDPSLEPYRSWLAAEFRRGDVAGIVAAGRALRDYDARAWASTIRVPVAVVVTTADRLVPPRKQRDLASVLGAMVFEQVGDHDSPITRGTAFGTVTRAAVDHVAARATTSTTTTTKSTATPASKRVSVGRRRRAAES